MNSNLLYNKRCGTSGVFGQLYETKLSSLILFRMIHDNDIEDFYLGTNVDELGEFDDICLKFKTIHIDKPIAVFLQAKHREDQNRALVVTNADLMRYFESYLKVRQRFNINSTDAFFRDSYENVECAFAFYTNTGDQIDKQLTENDIIDNINDIIGTGDDAFRMPCIHGQARFLNIILLEKIKKLAAVVADIVKNKGIDYENIMKDEHIQIYHVILSQKVFQISDVNSEGYCSGNFREDFFQTTDEHILLFKDNLYLEMLKEYELNKSEITVYLSTLSSDPNPMNLSKLIGCVIIYKNNKLEFVDKAMNSITHLKEKLDKINLPQSVVNKALEIAGKAKLCSELFKLPAAFGNTDMMLRGNDSKKDKRLIHLSNKIVMLLKASTEIEVNGEKINVINIDDNHTEKAIFEMNGGLGSAVGTLLILDEKTKLLKFNKDDKLKGYAKTLLDKIHSVIREFNNQTVIEKDKVKQIDKYRLNVNLQHFPRLTFGCNEQEKNYVIDFNSRLLFFTKQENESGVESILKNEIAKLQNIREKCNFQIKSDAIFVTYHDNIQKWWIKQTDTEYLTKSCNMYQESMQGFLLNPLLSIANALNRNKLLKHGIKFNTEYTDSWQLNESSSKVIFIVSEAIPFSVIKITQHFEDRNYILLDLNYILNLPPIDCSQLDAEVRFKTDSIFILTFITISHIFKSSREVKDVLRAFDGKQLIMITNKESFQGIKKYFRNTETVTIYDDISVINLTPQSQKNILENANAIFQGEQINLNDLLDDDSKKIIKGEQMDKIFNGESITLGQCLTNPYYEEIKNFFVTRIVLRKMKYVFDLWQCDEDDNYYDKDTVGTFAPNIIHLETFYDIDKRNVVITAEPGMGKSSLLTHLSLKTKAYDPKVWIVRINLLDCARLLHEWKENNVTVDIIEALKFVIYVSVVKDNCNNIMDNENITLIEKNNEIFLDNITNKKKTNMLFEINMFLHHYNRYKIIFIFDGFDEICPHYENEVIALIKIIKDSNHNHYHRIWIASRAYNEIVNNLEREFGEPYPLQPFCPFNQEIFIERFLQTKLNFNELNREHLKKINKFIIFMEQLNNVPEVIDAQDDINKTSPKKYKCQSIALHTVYLNVVQYFQNEIRHILYLEDKQEYINAWNINITKKTIRYYNGLRDDKESMHEFITIPLHIYMIANYIQNEIQDTKKDTKWDLTVNIFVMYERFIETKLKKIRFEDKNGMDLYKPDVQFTFERERIYFVNQHKKLAAYAMFFDDVNKLFSETELNDIKYTINTIKYGKEKTGVVIGVINNIPRFVHMTFAEYFAVEYLCDILKEEKCNDKLKSLWDFILNDMFFKNNVGLLNILDDKLATDEKLNQIIYKENNRLIILDILLKQSKGEYILEDFYVDDAIFVKKVYSSLEKALTENLRNLSLLFFSSLELVSENNIRILRDTVEIVDKILGIKDRACSYQKIRLYKSFIDVMDVVH